MNLLAKALEDTRIEKRGIRIKECFMMRYYLGYYFHQNYLEFLEVEYLELLEHLELLFFAIVDRSHPDGDVPHLVAERFR